MSQLRSAAENYLAMRRALGFKLERAAHLLPEFVDYLESTGAETITTELALAWATQPPKEPSQWWVERLDVVRGFARHLSAFDPATEVLPPTSWPDGLVGPSPTSTATPTSPH